MSKLNLKIDLTGFRPEIFVDINCILSWAGFVGKSHNK